jgi:hypothetical protein
MSGTAKAGFDSGARLRRDDSEMKVVLRRGQTDSD